MVILVLTEHELAIAEDIDEIGYGSLMGVASKPSAGEEGTEVRLPEPYKDFFDTLRRKGKFHEVIIHGGLPAYAEVFGLTANDRNCVKKYKFK